MLLGALFLLAGATTQAPPRYHVLLVGVAQPACDDFPRLSGVSIDLESLAQVLETSWHVPKDAVTIATSPETTTKSGIEALIRTKLIEPSKDRNDVVFFGYAGHGFQVVDLSKATKLSQAIVPSDAHALEVDEPAKGLKKGEVDPDSLLTGPEIGALFDGLKGKTDNVTLTFDSCHSGQITRGAYIARGPTSNPALDRYLSSGNPQKSPALATQINHGRGLVCLSAAAPEQLAWESGKGGVFTLALVAALQQPAQAGQPPSYNALFDRIRVNMLAASPPAPQDPQEEGDTGRTILGNEFVPRRAWMDVTVSGDGQIRLAGGAVHGIKEGFLIGLFPPGTMDLSAGPTWTASVTTVRTGDSDLQLSGDSGKLVNGHFEQLQGAEAIVIDGKPDGSIRVNISDLPADQQATLKRKLANAPMVDLAAPTNDFDFRIESPKTAGETDPNRWDLVDAKGGVEATFASDASTDVGSSAMAEELQSVARRSAVFALSPTDAPTTIVAMRFVPAEMNPGGDTVTKLLPDSALRPGQDATAKAKFAIQVRLQPAANAAPTFIPYLALLNANPHPADGQKRVAQLWPAADATGTVSSDPQTRRIRIEDGWRYLGVNNGLVTGESPNEVAAFYVDDKTDGVGAELFKLFATDQPEDFTPLLDPSRSAGRSAGSELARTLGNFAKGLPRTRAARGAATEHWCTASISLNVVKTP